MSGQVPIPEPAILSPERSDTVSRVQSHEDSPVWCDSLHPEQSSHCCQPSDTNTIDCFSRFDNRKNPLAQSPNFEEHAFEYQHDGKWWIIEIMATSKHDAIRRVHRMPFARYLGVVEGKISASVPASGFIVRLICTFKNLKENLYNLLFGKNL